MASDPTVSRLITALAADAAEVLAAIDGARAVARNPAWGVAGDRSPDHGTDAEHPLGIDLDATLVTAHSDKECAAPTFKSGFGHHPLWAFLDHGATGTGEPLAALLRPGNAGSNTAADHLAVMAAPWRCYVAARLPGRAQGADAGRRRGRHPRAPPLAPRPAPVVLGRVLPVPAVAAALDLIPEAAWHPAYYADGEPRDGAWVVEATGLMDLSGWPRGCG